MSGEVQNFRFMLGKSESQMEISWSRLIAGPVTSEDGQVTVRRRSYLRHFLSLTLHWWTLNLLQPFVMSQTTWFLMLKCKIQAPVATSSNFTPKTRNFPTGVWFKILSKNIIRYSTIDLSKYVGDFLFFMKEGEEEEPVIHNEAAVFRWE